MADNQNEQSTSPAAAPPLQNAQGQGINGIHAVQPPAATISAEQAAAVLNAQQSLALAWARLQAEGNTLAASQVEQVGDQVYGEEEFRAAEEWAYRVVEE